MPILLDAPSRDEVVRVHANGRLTRDDYTKFVPQLEGTLAGRGKLRILLDMQDFRGWDAGAAWEDCKFGFHHYRDVERIAMVGDRPWQRWMTALSRPFTRGEVRYFDRSEAEAAEAWIVAPPEKNVFGHPHGHYRDFNRLMVAAWRLGLGRAINSSAERTGRILVLTTRGRRSGHPRRTPLNYAPGEGAVFVLSGFGGRADWMKNLQADPECEVWLPDGGWAARATPVNDPRERLARIRQILQAGGRLLQRITGIDALAVSDDDLERAVEGVEVMRLDLLERAARGPGDLAWVWPVLGGAALLRMGLRTRRPRAAEAAPE